jgi:hypothetical protein
MSTAAQYASTVRAAVAQVTTANPNRDGTTGTYVTVFTAGASGSRIDDIYMTATVTTAAGMIRLFISNGTNIRMLSETPVTAITVAATTAAWTAVFLNQGLILPSGYLLIASTEVSNAINILVTRAGDF